MAKLRLEVLRSGSAREFTYLFDGLQSIYELVNLATLEAEFVRSNTAGTVTSTIIDQIYSAGVVRAKRVNFANGNSADDISDQKLNAYMRESLFNLSSNSEIPESILHVSKISVQSPGFIEVLGKLNPLESIRGFINDLHERKKDTSYRNRHEEYDMKIEEELRKLELERQKLSLLKDKRAFLDELGFSTKEIRDFSDQACM